MVFLTGVTAVAGFGGSGAAGASAAKWSALTITGPPLANGHLLAVTCRSAAACVAVGYYTNDQDVQVPFAERWNGRAWSADRVPAPPSGTAGSFVAVSCSSTSACTAVGGYTGAKGRPAMLVERWNGRAWSIETVSAPRPGGRVRLNSVACPMRRVCVAVGWFSDAANRQRALLERWDGARWSLTQIPSPRRDNAVSLRSVSCSSPDACMAVGAAGAKTVDAPLAERWNGRGWSIENTPKLHGSGGLSAVSCVSKAGCFAVGSVAIPGQGPTYPDQGPPVSTLAERWVRGKWSIQATPNPHLSAGGADGPPQVIVKLAAISCSSLRACTAVGSSDSLAPSDGYIVDYSEMLVEHWDGTRWVGQTAPRPPLYGEPQQPGGGPAFSGVACGSPTMCVAVGGPGFNEVAGSVDTSVQTTFAARWNGHVWQIQDTANGVGTSGGRLESISCPAATTCFAVGGGNPNGGPPLAEQWDGARWNVLPTPDPGAGAELRGISCTSVRECTAVGGAGGEPLAEHWDGNAWTLRSTPKAPGGSSLVTGDGLSGVSCLSPTFCVAVGAPHLAEIWNGTTWTLENTGSDGQLDAVSCTSRTSCVGVGATDGEIPATLAESWDGSTWKVQRTPTPFNYVAGLSGVSCTTTTACTAVGSFGEQLIDRWDGSAWRSQRSPSTPGGPNGFSALTSVSCTSNTTCIAVGESTVNDSAPSASLAESWNGTRWIVQPTPDQGPLQGVSCAKLAACTAVGMRSTNTLPAALRYH